MSSPAFSPPFSRASGIIVSISMTSRAPAAKPWMPPVRAGEATSAISPPPHVARAQTTVTSDHWISRWRRLLPPSRESAVAAMDSGRLDMKIATSSARDTPSPAASPMPSTSCSGMPSSSAPTVSAAPEDEPPDLAAERSTARSPRK